jgi:hypothetical protein
MINYKITDVFSKKLQNEKLSINIGFQNQLLKKYFYTERTHEQNYFFFALTII